MRIGTRRSPLALAQTHFVAHLLGGAEIIELTTTGDRGTGGEQAAAAHPGPEDKSRWVDTIEQALLAGEIDLAVHSAKDLPCEPAAGLELLGAPARAPAEDVLCLAGPEQGGLERLAPGARVGTSSIRRTAQLRAAREDLEVVAIGGNVDTRLRKLADPDRGLDAIVLARAGLQRLRDAGAISPAGMVGAIGPAGAISPAGTVGPIDATGPLAATETVLDLARFVPAPGQGAIALQARTEDSPVRDAVAPILDADATACLLAERSLARALGASCHTPLGAHAMPAGCGCLHLRAWIGLPDGSAFLTDDLLGGFYDPAALGERMAERMSAAGARDLLSRAQEMAGARV